MLCLLGRGHHAGGFWACRLQGHLQFVPRQLAQVGVPGALSSKPDTQMALPTRLVVEVGGVRQGVLNVSIPALRIDQFIKPGARGDGEEVARVVWKE